MVDNPKRYRIRLSVRGLMVLLLILGTWMGRQVNKAREQREAVAAVKEYGGWVTYDHEPERVMTYLRMTRRLKPRGPQWLRERLGDEFFQEVVEIDLHSRSLNLCRSLVNRNRRPCEALLRRVAKIDSVKQLTMIGDQTTDEGLKSVGRMTQLERLTLRGGRLVTDEGVGSLTTLKSLKELTITSSQITDQGIRFIGELANLEFLNLLHNRYTDGGMKPIGRLPELRFLSIGGSTFDRAGNSMPADITDVGIAWLRDLTKLESLDIRDTKVTDRGLVHLQGMKNLNRLLMPRIPMTESVVAFLVRLKDLELLDVSQMSVSDHAWRHLRQLPKLGCLWISRDQSPAGGISELKATMPNLVIDVVL